MSDLQPQERSAKERLQASREALVGQLRRPSQHRPANATRSNAASSDHDLHAENPEGFLPGNGDDSVRSRASNIWSAAKYGVRTWWEFHPVRAVGAIAEPLVADYAERRPFRLLSIAAGVGATLVVVKPWRLISVGGLAVAALKSSQVSSFVLSLIAQPKNNDKDTP